MFYIIYTLIISVSHIANCTTEDKLQIVQLHLSVFRVRATFYVITRDSDGSASETEQANSHVEKGTEVVSTLKRKLETDAEMLDFKVIQLDTLGKAKRLKKRK